METFLLVKNLKVYILDYGLLQIFMILDNQSLQDYRSSSILEVTTELFWKTFLSKIEFF